MNRLIFCTLIFAFLIIITVDTSYAQKVIVVENLKVETVVDGETIQLTTGAKVRYIGIDIPASNYFSATEANRQLVQGKTIKLEFDVEKQDGYGRVLAYAFVDSIFVNAWLIKEGFARFLVHPRNARYQHIFLDLEQKAKKSNIGIWAKKTGKSKNELQGKLNFDIENTFVYVTSGGKRYHRANCREINSHKIPMVLRNAKLTYEACKVCKPSKPISSKSVAK